MQSNGRLCGSGLGVGDDVCARTTYVSDNLPGGQNSLPSLTTSAIHLAISSKLNDLAHNFNRILSPSSNRTRITTTFQNASSTARAQKGTLLNRILLTLVNC
jgi:hypothetical protein